MSQAHLARVRRPVPPTSPAGDTVWWGTVWEEGELLTLGLSAQASGARKACPKAGRCLNQPEPPYLRTLFLDELPEFALYALDTLRQPLEDGVVTVAQASGSVRLPAEIQLVGAKNPCRRGCATLDACACTPAERARYVGRLSAPLLDRIDLQVDVGPIAFYAVKCNRFSVTWRACRNAFSLWEKVQLKTMIRVNAAHAPSDLFPAQRCCRSACEARSS